MSAIVGFKTGYSASTSETQLKARESCAGCERRFTPKKMQYGIFYPYILKGQLVLKLDPKYIPEKINDRKNIFREKHYGC